MCIGGEDQGLHVRLHKELTLLGFPGRQAGHFEQQLMSLHPSLPLLLLLQEVADSLPTDKVATLPPEIVRCHWLLPPLLLLLR